MVCSTWPVDTARGQSGGAAAAARDAAQNSPSAAPQLSRRLSMTTLARVLGLLAVLTTSASVARAQYPQRREGFWIGFGLGYGSANVTCDGCGSGPRTGGVTAFVKLGGTPR